MKIGRRKFITIFGTVSLGSVTGLNKDADALNIDINRFQSNEKVSLRDVDSIVISIKDGQIVSNYIDYRKDAELSIYASVGGNSLGEVSSKSVDVKRSGTDLSGENIKINSSDLSAVNQDNQDKSSIDIGLEFRIKHPSIEETIVEQTTFKLALNGAGELISHRFENYGKFGEVGNSTLDNVKTLSGTNLNVLTENTDMEQIKSLIGGGSVKNGSSYSIPSGVIDIDEIQFEHSTPRDYDISNKKEASAKSISGEDLPVLRNSQPYMEQIKSLIGGGSVKNGSSYSISSGVIDIDEIQFDHSTPRDYDISNKKEANAKSISGENLPVLKNSQPYIERIKSLIGGGSVKNGSSYSIPSGVIDIDEIQFDHSTPRDYDISIKKEGSATSISGGDLPVLKNSQPYIERIKSLIGGGSVKNGSSYSIPSGVIDIDEIQFDHSTPRDYDISNKKEANATSFPQN